MSVAPAKYAFGPFQMDVAERLLLRDGTAVPLTAKAFDLLAVLLEEHGHLLEKQELLRRVWPDSFVEEAVLSVNIAAIRRALGDDDHHFIETVPRLGYRFCGELHDEMDADVPGAPDATQRGEAGTMPPRGGHKVRWAAMVVTVVVLAAIALEVGSRTVNRSVGNSVAVLPLRSLSSDPEQQHFADAMTDLMLTDLGKIPQMRVVSRQSVLQYENTDKPLPQIARELGVDCIVEGTVQRDGNRVRITA